MKETLRDQIVYSTVRIITGDDKPESIGTGFFVIDQREGKSTSFLVTNCHVVKKYSKAWFMFCVADKNNEPIDDQHIVISVTDLQERCIRHPDNTIDICFIILADKIKEANEKGLRPFFKCVGTGLFITPEIIEKRTAIEDIIMIGYPEGLMDEKNNKPVTRKGITATSIYSDYQGRKEFMVDVACFHGSSGSPVFIDISGLGINKTADNQSSIGFNHEYYLAGIVRAVPKVTVQGEIKIVDIPTDKKTISETELMTNLGIVIKSEKIFEMLDVIKENWK